MSCAGAQSPSKGSDEGCALPRCGKEGTGPAFAASSDGKALDEAEVELKLLHVQLKPRCLWLFPLCVPSQRAPCCSTS